MSVIRAIIDRIKTAKAELIANREAEVLRIAYDQIALLKLRIQSSGQNSDGQAFLPYTPDYAKRRKAAGYQVGFVDLTRTGRLLASISPRITSSNIFSATVEIGPDNDESKKILEGLQGKRPNILEPTKEELEIIKAANRERILKYFNF